MAGHVERQTERMDLEKRIWAHLSELVSYPDRRVGGPGNRAATAAFTRAAEAAGFEVRRTSFACVDWRPGEAALSSNHATLGMTVHVGPYSLPCDVTARLVAASSVEEVESESVRDSVLLLHGEV